MSEYARVVGKSDNTLRPYRDAANVATKLNVTNVRELLDKAKQNLSKYQSAAEVFNSLNVCNVGV